MKCYALGNKKLEFLGVGNAEINSIEKMHDGKYVSTYTNDVGANKKYV
jgi:hypothetical protein